MMLFLEVLFYTIKAADGYWKWYVPKIHSAAFAINVQ